MLIGGIANLVWGEPRTTVDLDITVDVGQGGTGEFLAVARQCGEPLADDPADLAERGRVVPIRTHGGVRVDFVLATLPFELDAIQRAARVPVAGVEVRVCTAEDLIVMKAVSQRPRDHEDILGVLRRQGEALDLTRLDRTLEALAADLEQPELADRWHEAKRAAGLA